MKLRGRLWRVLYWVALVAILAEILGLVATFGELKRHRVQEAAELAPDQIAAVARLWPSLTAAQKPEVLRALSWSGLSYRVSATPPEPAPGEAHVPAIETAMAKRLDGANAVALIASKRLGNPGVWGLSTAPLRIFVQTGPGEWLETDARGELGARFYGLPTGFWIGVVGLLLAAGVLLAILREGRALARLSAAMDAFAATGAPQPLRPGGSQQLAELGRGTERMQRQIAALLKERAAMLGAIAHDIKTYVQRLKLRLELIEEPGQVEKAARDLDAMNHFVEDALLVAVHAQPLAERRSVDLAELVAQETEAARLSGGDATLRYEGEGLWRVQGDAVGLARAVGNIVGNALRYGGAAHIALRRDGKRIAIAVDDSGPGIPEAQREAVFAPFERGENSRNRVTGGTGLGLAIARGVAEQHDGAVEIGDAPGGGARVTISLPASE